MVSFVCDYCQETLKKAKLDQHRQRCRNAQFSCIDCSTTFHGMEYRAHTACISEAEKYQKSLYKGNKKDKLPQQNGFTSHPVSNAVQNTSCAPKSMPLIQEIKLKEKANGTNSAPVADEAEEMEVESKSHDDEKEETLTSEAVLKSVRLVVKKNSPLSFKQMQSKVAKKLHKKFPKKSLADLKVEVEEHIILKWDDDRVFLER
ncbi:hypothetical protein HDU67_006849 [Dinochytrium kinnereticum]|nr:hypothetical protein HDU67_006849 [Dinochytrium kinnereticum]